MSWLDEIYKFQSGNNRLQNLAEWAKLPFTQDFQGNRQALGQTVEDFSGRMGVPVDLHVSELITGGPNQMTSSKISATPKVYAPENNIDQPINQPPQDQNTGDVLTGTGDNNNNNNNNDTIEELRRLAEEGKNSSLEDIKNRLQLIRDQATRSRGQISDIYNTTKGDVEGTFGDLLTSAENKKNNAIETLDQEDIGVQNLYGRAGGTARRAMESALLRNRLRARAQNRLNSSFYEDTQAGVNEEAARTIGSLAEEEAGKRAAIGTRKSETSNWFDEQSVNIGREKSRYLADAAQNYRDKMNDVEYMERSYGIDSTEAAEQAEIQYKSALSGIEQYIKDREYSLLSLAASSGESLDRIINNFSAIDQNLSGALSKNKAYEESSNLPGKLATVNPANVTENTKDFLPFYRQYGYQYDDENSALSKLLGY